MEAIFNTGFSNVESPIYKLTKELLDRQLFTTLKSFNFLLSIPEGQRKELINNMTNQQIMSAVNCIVGYDDKKLKDKMEKEFNYDYPILKEENLGDYLIQVNCPYTHIIYTPNNTINIKAYLDHIEVPTIYITPKGLITLNFDVDWFSSFRYSEYADNFRHQDYLEFLELMGLMKMKMLLTKYLL
jgi:hypothetical protein